MGSATDAPKVGLFVTCLVDLFRPSVGFAAVRLLEAAGCRVEVPTVQTCCGQPAYNSGDRPDAVAIARNVIGAFETFDHVVVPSGSCAGMIKEHYPRLLADDADWAPRANHVARRCHELVSFLVDVRGWRPTRTRYDGRVTYHDSCSGLRELGIKAQPRYLLGDIDGVVLTEMADTEVCCGFGGTFCIKYPDISNRMVGDKVRAITTTGADTLLAGDLGCLLNLAGRLKRDGSPIRVRHVAEVLAGTCDDAPPIGEATNQPSGRP